MAFGEHSKQDQQMSAVLEAEEAEASEHSAGLPEQSLREFRSTDRDKNGKKLSYDGFFSAQLVSDLYVSV